jgi:hypothetical protein
LKKFRRSFLLTINFAFIARVLATLKNQMFIAIDDKQYDLFKITDNAYSTLNRNITLIKQ